MEHLSFDQWKQNQVVALQYIDNGKTQRAGLRIYDRPKNVPLDEIFDRSRTKNALPKNSYAYDSIMKEIKASTDRGDNGGRKNVGEAKIVFPDEKGNIVKTLSGIK
jgi:hypothetical protein